jgi:hypothetical protein
MRVLLGMGALLAVSVRSDCAWKGEFPTGEGRSALCGAPDLRVPSLVRSSVCAVGTQPLSVAVL